MQKFSYLRSANADYIDDLFARYSQDPASVDDSWRYFFEGIELGVGTDPEGAVSAPSTPVTSSAITPGAGSVAQEWIAESRVVELILAYRQRGGLLAHLDPLSSTSPTHPSLELARFGLTNADLSKSFAAGRLVGLDHAKLSDILALLRDTYCRTVAVEFMHIMDDTAREWIRNRMESARNREALDPATRINILKRLSESETFERFLHTRYVAQKRFSVEGGESIIPSLDCVFETGAELGAQEFVVGMAHRGRLNVLHNTFGKKAESMFTEFEGNYKVDLSHGEGDVKYHKGYSHDLVTRQGKSVHLSLAANPSHLEFINPVIEGIARAKQQRRKDRERKQVIPIAIHGDAAFAGQGVCYETLNLCLLPGYTTGGTIHIVLNNQVGFTASAAEGRSTRYSTDLAKMLDSSPIFHVNGDDAEAVWWVSKIATEYRQKFGLDSFIDLVCYRKYGHNEGDEPAFTQPVMYKQIKTHSTPRETYAQALTQAGVIQPEDAQAIVDEIIARYTQAQAKARAEAPYDTGSVFEGAWKGLRAPVDSDLFGKVATAVEEGKLKAIAEKINTIPADFHLHPKLARFFEARLKAVQDGKGIDWGNGESLAYATLLEEGFSVRLSGQDAGRGTFTHRHALLSDSETGAHWLPLNHISDQQGVFEVYNSHLSETGVMGFEYGHALAEPHTLTLWEGQFGDFGNGAQVIIDQFLATGESKWQRANGLVLLLPHGYEGQGPEHSSARLERFLQLCGRGNMIVANFTTPAQLFHALRRQLKRDFRKPLVIMSPKSMLRHAMAVSNIGDFTQGGFQEVLDDPETTDGTLPKAIKRVILCSGKLYYDLVNERTARKRPDVAIVRLEQLYPWPAQRLAQVMNRYSMARELIWCQEEPRNMGAWSYIFNMWNGGYELFQDSVLGRTIRYAGREVAASPAVGSIKLHEVEQKALLEKAFGE